MCIRLSLLAYISHPMVTKIAQIQLAPGKRVGKLS